MPSQRPANLAGFKPNWPPLPAKSPFTAVPIADPDTHPSLDDDCGNRKTKKGGGGSKKKDAPQPVSPAELARGRYKRVSKGVYELLDDSHAASRRSLPPSHVSCDEGEVKVVSLFESVSLDKDYGTYILTWNSRQGLRKLARTPVEPKDITIQQAAEFGLDIEAAANKSPGSEVGMFVRNHPEIYRDLVVTIGPAAIKEPEKPVQPPPLPHSVLSVTVAQLPFTDALDVRFQGELKGKCYTIGYETTRGGRNGSSMVKMMDGSSEKLVPSRSEICRFIDAVKEAYNRGDPKVTDFVSRYPAVMAYPPIF